MHSWKVIRLKNVLKMIANWIKINLDCILLLVLTWEERVHILGRLLFAHF